MRYTLRAGFALMLVGLARPAFADDVAVAPPPRCVEAEPFDLTYLPPDCGAPDQPRLLIAVRPGAVFQRPDAKKVVATLDEAALALAAQWLGVESSPGPGIAALDTVLLTGHVTVTHTDGEERPNSLIGFANGMVVRTREEYDWRAAVQKWYPTAKKAKQKGKRFYLVPTPPILAEFFPKADGALFAAYVADDRTLVLGPEDSIRKLIDRVAAGEKAPVPAGWDEVERAALAVAVTVTDKKMVENLPGQDVAEAKTAFRIAKLSETAVFGVWARQTTAVRIAFTARSPKAAQEVAKLLRSLRSPLAEALREPPIGDRTASEDRLFKTILKLTDTGKIERSGTTVRITAEANGSVLDYLVPILAEFDVKAVK